MAAMSSAWPDWETINARHVAAHRAQAVKAARAAAAAAAAHGVKVIVFGSLATGRFHRSSDLDLALDGPEERLHRAEGAAFGAAAGEGFEPDIVWLSHAEPGLAARIRETGRDPAELD
jgi:predicted nucleotidyltransferase